MSSSIRILDMSPGYTVNDRVAEPLLFRIAETLPFQLWKKLFHKFV